MNLSQAEETFEWRSILDALRSIYVDAARATLGKSGVVAFTDGACIKNPGGPAGWSSILLGADDVTAGIARPAAERIECFGHIPASPTTTNNRAEITAVLAVLCLAPHEYPLKIYSDSEYTIKVAQGTYQMKANPDLWSMYRLLFNRRKSSTTFEWVRGHAGHDLNERADELAGLGAWNNNADAYRQWQASNTPEARNLPSSAEMAQLRQHVQTLKLFFDTLAPESSRVNPNERAFIDDMAKRLQKNKFSPTPKQSDWVKGLLSKYRLQ